MCAIQHTDHQAARLTLAVSYGTDGKSAGRTTSVDELRVGRLPAYRLGGTPGQSGVLPIQTAVLESAQPPGSHYPPSRLSDSSTREPVGLFVYPGPTTGYGPISIPRAPLAGVGPFVYPGLPTGYGLISIPRAPFAGGCSSSGSSPQDQSGMGDPTRSTVLQPA
jgi:hypothetical protein